MNTDGYDYSLRITLRKDGSAFYGPGVSQLLLLTEELESLRAAAMTMHMAYSKAYRIVKEAEEALGYKLLESSIGGAKGGYSRFTEKGQAFVNKYREIDKKVNDLAQSLTKELFLDL